MGVKKDGSVLSRPLKARPFGRPLVFTHKGEYLLTQKGEQVFKCRQSRYLTFGAGAAVAGAEKVQGVQGLLVEPYVCVRASRV